MLFSKVINYLFISLPEFYIIILLGFAIIGETFRRVKTKALLMGSIIALASDLMWYLDYFSDFRVIITILTLFLLFKTFTKQSWSITVALTIIPLFIVMISEIVIMAIFLQFVNYEDLVSNNLSIKFFASILYLIPLVILIWLLNRRNFSILGWYQKSLHDKRITYYWISIIFLSIFQLFLIIYINYSFYMNNSFIKSKVVMEIYGFSVFSTLIVLTNIILIFFIIQLMNISRKKEISKTESSYNIYLENLLEKLKMERHDFVNEIQTIQGLVQTEMFDHLKDYMNQLVDNIKRTNRVIKIKNVTVSALLHTKIEQLEEKGVSLDILVNTDDTFEDIKAYDLVKIISNLLDNALRAVIEGNNGEPRIELFWGKEENTAIIRISNNGPKIEKKSLVLLFKEGYTTKENKENSGYGLAIIKSIVNKYKGIIEVESNENLTSFIIKLPL